MRVLKAQTSPLSRSISMFFVHRYLFGKRGGEKGVSCLLGAHVVEEWRRESLFFIFVLLASGVEDSGMFRYLDLVTSNYPLGLDD